MQRPVQSRSHSLRHSSRSADKPKDRDTRVVKHKLKPPIKGRNRILLELANKAMTQTNHLAFETSTDPAENLQKLVDAYEDILSTEDLSPIHLSTVLFMSIKTAIQDGMDQTMLSHHQEFLNAVLDRLPLASLDSRRLSAVIWAMGQLGPGVKSLDVNTLSDGFMDGLVQLCNRRLVNFKAKQIVNTMTGLALMRCPNVDGLIPALTASCRLRLSQFSSEQLCRLAWALGELKISNGDEVMESLAVTVRNRLKSTTPSELSLFLWAGGRLRSRMTASTMTAFMNKIEAHLRILQPKEVARSLWALTQISYRPRFEFLDVVEVYVASRSSAFQPSDIVDCLDALATFSYAPGTLVEVGKAFILDHQEAFTVKQLLHAMWTLSLLDALDVEFLNLAISRISDVWSHPTENQDRVDGAKLPKVDDEDLTRLYHCLLHLQLLQGEAAWKLLPTELEAACRQAWNANTQSRPSNDTLSDILHGFEYAGYTVESPKRDGTTGWSIPCIQHSRGKVVVEVITEESCFVNEQHRLQGYEKWKHKILKARGWDVLIVFEDVWMGMDFREQMSYLSERIDGTSLKNV